MREDYKPNNTYRIVPKSALVAKHAGAPQVITADAARPRHTVTSRALDEGHIAEKGAAAIKLRGPVVFTCLHGAASHGCGCVVASSSLLQGCGGS